MGGCRIAQACAMCGSALVALGPLRPAADVRLTRAKAGNTFCTSCHCRMGRDHCVRLSPSSSMILLRRTCPLYQSLLSDARFHELLLRSIGVLPMRHAARGASHAAVLALSARSMTGASLQPLRRGGRLPQPDNAAVAALSRPQSLSRHHRGAGVDDATRGDATTDAATDRGRWRRPADRRALAAVVVVSEFVVPFPIGWCVDFGAYEGQVCSNTFNLVALTTSSVKHA